MFVAGYVGSILLTWSDDIKHTWDDSRSQALLFIWHHSTLSILCCGVDLIKVLKTHWCSPQIELVTKLILCPWGHPRQQPALTLDKCARIFLFRIFSLSRNHLLSLQDCMCTLYIYSFFSDITIGYNTNLKSPHLTTQRLRNRDTVTLSLLSASMSKSSL